MSEAADHQTGLVATYVAAAGVGVVATDIGTAAAHTQHYAKYGLTNEALNFLHAVFHSTHPMWSAQLSP